MKKVGIACLISIITLIILYYAGKVYAYNSNLGVQGNFGSSTRFNASIINQPGTGTTGGSDSAGFREYYGTQTTIGTGSTGYVTSTTGLPYIEYLYSAGSSTFSYKGFDFINIGGNVGIGTTTPQQKVSIVRTGVVHNGGGAMLGLSDATNRQLLLGYDDTADVGFIGALNPGVAWKNIAIASGGGAVGIGTTTPSQQLHTTGGVRFQNLGAGAVQSDAGGNLSVVSDERMKDIQGTFTASIAEILGINPILYKWNKLSGLEMENCYAGFSAQNVKKYIPEAIGVDANGYYSFNDRPVVAALVNCIKELQKEIDELKVKTGIEIHEYKIEPCKDIERCVKTSDIALRETPRLAGEETHEYIEKKEDSEYKWNYQMKEGFRYDSNTRQFYRKESFEEARDRKNRTISEGL